MQRILFRKRALPILQERVKHVFFTEVIVMLTNEFKKAALQKLNQMSGDDFIGVFEKIGSQRTEGEDNLSVIVEQDLSNYKRNTTRLERLAKG